MTTLLIALGNKARHGKDTAGEAVVDYYARKRQIQINRGLKPAAPVAKIYKWADALYAEVNQFLSTDSGKYWVTGGNVAGIYRYPIFKEVASQIPNWVVPEPNAIVEPRAPYGKHPKLLQWWGTEYRRNNFGTDYWVKKTIDKIKDEKPDIALITDTRFVNEANAIRELGGYVVNFSRVKNDGSLFVAPDRPADHISETALDSYAWDFKFMIGNGHAAMTAEIGITLVEHLWGLHV